MGFKKDARELNNQELQALEDRFMQNFRDWSVLIGDRDNSRSHVIRLHYQATVDFLLSQGLINTNKDTNQS